jgi:hypothetical protein
MIKRALKAFYMYIKESARYFLFVASLTNLRGRF